MKCAYDAANGVEAHMIVHLLQGHGIAARIDGEYLTGAVGELPAAGLVRVMVDDEAHPRAREIILQWERATPPTSTQTPNRNYGLGYGFFWFAVGMVATGVAMLWIHRPMASDQGLDINGDGRLDEKYFYSGRTVSKVESDANLDGKMDSIVEYDSRGVTIASRADLDFDGRFEVRNMFKDGLVARSDIDRDMDGNPDVREEYSSGVLRSATLYTLDGRKLVKRIEYQQGFPVRAEYDANGDGLFDTTYLYDRYGEIVDTQRR